MTVSFFFQTLITGISNGMVAYLMVAGVSLIISGMNMVNFGQGAFYVLGTYLTYTIAGKAWLCTRTFHRTAHCGWYWLLC